MARQTVTLDVGVKLAIVQVEVPAWLRAALIDQGWTPPNVSPGLLNALRQPSDGYAKGGIIQPDSGIFVVGETGPESDGPEA